MSTLATKIVLGKRPESFKKVVTFDLLDGTKGAINCEFKYRTRTEFAAFLDKMFADAGEEAPADDAEKITFAVGRVLEKNGEYLADVLKGWDLDIPLTHASARQLADELPAAAAAVMDTYRVAITEGRLGN